MAQRFLTDTDDRVQVPTFVRLPTGLRQRLAGIADQEEAPVADVIRRGLHAWVQSYESSAEALEAHRPGARKN